MRTFIVRIENEPATSQMWRWATSGLVMRFLQQYLENKITMESADGARISIEETSDPPKQR